MCYETLVNVPQLGSTVDNQFYRDTQQSNKQVTNVSKIYCSELLEIVRLRDGIANPFTDAFYGTMSIRQFHGR